MKNTANYNLKKPESDDAYDIADFNENADRIDAQMKRLQDEKQDMITGAAATVASANLSSNRVLVSNNSGKIGASTVTATHLSCLQNIKSNIQGQLDTKQSALGFLPVQQGGGSGQLTNKVYLGWSGSSLKAQVDATDMGNILTDGEANSAVLPISKLDGMVPVNKGGTGAGSWISAVAALTGDLFHYGTLGDVTATSTDAYENVFYTTPVHIDGASYCLVVRPNPKSTGSKMLGIRKNATGSVSAYHSGWNSGNANGSWTFGVSADGQITQQNG